MTNPDKKNFFQQYGGPVADILFALFYALIFPQLLGRATAAAGQAPEYYLRIGAAAMVVYPLACAAMLQKIATDSSLRDGLMTFHGFLWQRFTWPLGMLFWLSLVCHSVFMASIIASGESYYMEGGRQPQGVDQWLIIGSWILFFIVTVFLVFRASGIKISNPFQWDDRTSLGWKIFSAVLILVLGPLVLFIAASVVLMVPFLLYALLWGYSIHKIKKGGAVPLMVRPGRATDFIAATLIFLYALSVTFFMDLLVSIQPAVLQGASASSRAFVLAVIMIYCYIPYRAFFALYSGKRMLGWITFLLSVAVMTWETWVRISGG